MGWLGDNRATASMDAFSSAFDSILALDLNEDDRRRVERLRTEMFALFANPTESGISTFADGVSNLIEDLEQSGRESLLNRVRDFGEDLGNAMEDGFQLALVQGLADITMGALLDLGSTIGSGLVGGVAKSAGGELADKMEEGAQRSWVSKSFFWIAFKLGDLVGTFSRIFMTAGKMLFDSMEEGGRLSWLRKGFFWVVKGS